MLSLGTLLFRNIYEAGVGVGVGVGFGSALIYLKGSESIVSQGTSES